MCRPWSIGSPQKTVSFARLDDVARDGGTASDVGVLERAADAEQVRPDPDDDPVEHDRRDHLVGADRRLQEAGDPRQKRAREHRGRRRDEDERAARQVDALGISVATSTAAIEPDEVLPLAADVEEAAAERERDGEPGEHERRPQDQRLLQVGGRED